MFQTTHSLSFSTDSVWEQRVNYSAKPSRAWRSISVSASLTWPEILLVNGYHQGKKMKWFITSCDNTFSGNDIDFKLKDSLGSVRFLKDMGFPCGHVTLCMKEHGFQELWERATHRLIGNVSIRMEVFGLTPPDTPVFDPPEEWRWTTSKSSNLYIQDLQFSFNLKPQIQEESSNP